MTEFAGRGAGPGDLATARERFLTADVSDDSNVRRTILASWWRSRTWNVAADHVETPYVKDPDLETPLIHSAGPILNRLQDQLGDLAVSMVLTDDRGLVLDRRTQDSGLEHHLDDVQLAPGFSYAEEFVGTNGIGTALEGRQPVAVYGHEHYAERLDTLGCAGVPIRHPISGHVLGLLDLTTWRHEAGPLLMTLAKATAQDIEKELTRQVGIRELSLFSEYLRACQRGGGIVVAVNNDLVMLNEHARERLAPEDQSALLSRAAEVLTSRRNRTVSVDLPSGASARMSCRPVSSEAGPAGGVARAWLVRDAAVPVSTVPSRRSTLPGLAGTGALWLRACNNVRDLCQRRQWSIVEGESGVGKHAIVQAAHTATRAGTPFTVIDVANTDALVPMLREALNANTGTMVLRHVERLSPEAQHAVADLLGTTLAAKQARPWITATTSEDGHNELEPALLQLFPDSVTVPPLRHHIDDVRELVPFLLARLTPNTRLVSSQAATQLLLRSNWPGNIAQLRQVLRKVVHTRRAGVIEPEDLPPECRAVLRRVLNPLESMERDAVVRSLLDAEGNKAKAASFLGMSRATIYRKIREYGIDIPS
jgi:transcriptional regulator of acetoin/glycerol metabolism